MPCLPPSRDSLSIPRVVAFEAEPSGEELAWQPPRIRAHRYVDPHFGCDRKLCKALIWIKTQRNQFSNIGSKQNEIS